MKTELTLKRGRHRALNSKERQFIFEYCEKNLLTSTDELVEIVAKKLDKEKATIRSFMWKEGYRPREEVRVNHYIDRIARQVAKDTGFAVEPYKPSPEFFRILRKIKKQKKAERRDGIRQRRKKNSKHEGHDKSGKGASKTR